MHRNIVFIRVLCLVLKTIWYQIRLSTCIGMVLYIVLLFVLKNVQKETSIVSTILTLSIWSFCKLEFYSSISETGVFFLLKTWNVAFSQAVMRMKRVANSANLVIQNLCSTSYIIGSKSILAASPTVIRTSTIIPTAAAKSARLCNSPAACVSDTSLCPPHLLGLMSSEAW